MCYITRKENAITGITQKNIQGNPLYAKLQKKVKNSIYTLLRLRNEWNLKKLNQY